MRDEQDALAVAVRKEASILKTEGEARHTAQRIVEERAGVGEPAPDTPNPADDHQREVGEQPLSDASI